MRCATAGGRWRRIGGKRKRGSRPRKRRTFERSKQSERESLPPRKAWRGAVGQLANADRSQQAYERIKAAVGMYRPDGTLNDRTWAEAQIAQALPKLSGTEW